MRTTPSLSDMNRYHVEAKPYTRTSTPPHNYLFSVGFVIEDTSRERCPKTRNKSLERGGASLYLLQTGPELPVDDVPVGVLGQEVEQQLGLDLGQAAAAVGGDTLLELRPREDARAAGVVALAKGLQLPHQTVELGVVESVYCLAAEGKEEHVYGGAVIAF